MAGAIAALAATATLAAQSGGRPVPASAPGTCDRVVFELFQGHYARALQQLDGAPSAGTSEADRANLRGLALMMSGQPAKAIESFDTALDLRPSLQEARLNRGIVRLQSSDYARAAADFQQIWDDATSPLRGRAAYHHAIASDAMQKPEEAASWIARALEADPRLDDALFYSGVLAEQRGALEVAGRAYKSYLDRHPESVVAMLRFGIAAQRSGFSDTARKYLGRVTQIAPSSAEAVEARKFLAMWD
jgi:tetratricopeptide (TPR) repeat protein